MLLESKQNQRLMEDWKKLRGKIKKLRSDLQKPRSSLAFSFVEVGLGSVLWKDGCGLVEEKVGYVVIDCSTQAGCGLVKGGCSLDLK